MTFSKKNRLFAAATTVLSLSACMDIRMVDRGAKNSVPPPARSQAVISPWEIQSTGEFNGYRVAFRGLPEGVLNVERETLAGGDKDAPTKVLPLRLGVVRGQALDSQVEPGKNYLYHWVDAETGTRLPGKSILVKVPLDVRVDEEVTPDGPLGKIFFAPEKTRPIYGKILFSEKGMITTRGHRLVIEADLLEGAQAIIRTFAPGDEAKNEGDLVDGGEISISAKRAVGEFHFELSGRQGFPGAPGKAPGPELKGLPGGSGRAGQVSPGSRLSSRCVVRPGDGGAGTKGETGYPGEPGGPGGDTATLVLKIEDVSGFRRTFSGRPGRGGEGGLGGEGGEGGDGGKPGRPGYPCQAQHGPRGPRGDRGRHGDWGASGKESPVHEWRDGRMEEIKRGD